MNVLANLISDNLFEFYLFDSDGNLLLEDSFVPSAEDIEETEKSYTEMLEKLTEKSGEPIGYLLSVPVNSEEVINSRFEPLLDDEALYADIDAEALCQTILSSLEKLEKTDE